MQWVALAICWHALIGRTRVYFLGINSFLWIVNMYNNSPYQNFINMWKNNEIPNLFSGRNAASEEDRSADSPTGYVGGSWHNDSRHGSLPQMLWCWCRHIRSKWWPWECRQGEETFLVSSLPSLSIQLWSPNLFGMFLSSKYLDSSCSKEKYQMVIKLWW